MHWQQSRSKWVVSHFFSLFESLSILLGKSVKTPLTVRSLISIYILSPSLGSQATVTCYTAKVVPAPVLSMYCNNVITGAGLSATETYLSKKLCVVGLAVGQTFLLIMTSSIKGFLTTSADKVLRMPRLSDNVDDTTFYRFVAACTDWSCSVVTTKAKQFTILFTGFGCQHLATLLARVVIRVNRFCTENTLSTVPVSYTHLTLPTKA